MQVDFDKSVNSDITKKGFRIDDDWLGLFGQSESDNQFESRLSKIDFVKADDAIFNSAGFI